MDCDLSYKQSEKLLNVTIREYDVVMHLAAQVLDDFYLHSTLFFPAN